MTIFYDPRERKTKTWVLVAIIIIPLIFIIVGWMFTSKLAKENNQKEQTQQEEDIFKQVK